MVDRLESMSLLIHIVEAGSISSAARKLGMPLPTVSRKLADLETHIKTRLVIRSTRGLKLTDAGRAYVAASRRILEDVEQAERSAAGEYSAPKGEMVVTAPIVFGRLHVLPVITEFLKAYPEINVRLVLGDRTINFLEEHVDLAVRIGELPDSSLIATKVSSTRRVVCASPKYFLERGKPQHPNELRKHACVTFEGLMPPNEWTFPTAKAAVSVRVHSRLVLNTAEAAIDAAIAGVGVTRVFSYQVLKPCEEGLLERVLREFEPAPAPVHLVYAGQGLLPLKVRAFIDFSVPRLRAIPT